MRLFGAAVAALLLLAGICSARADPPPVTASPAPWLSVGSTVTLSPTTSSVRAQMGWATVSPIPSPPPSIAYVCNWGSDNGYVKMGDSSVTATNSDTPILAGACQALAVAGNTYVAAISASTSTTIKVQNGNGWPMAGGTGSGGGTGTFMLTTASNAQLPTALANLKVPAYYAEAYGVVCDGIADAKSAIQALINSISAGLIIFPARTCSVGSSIDLSGKSYIILAGQGSESTTLKGTGNFSVIKDIGTKSAVDGRNGVVGMRLSGPGKSNTSAQGVTAVYVNNLLMRDLIFTGFRTAISLKDQWQAALNHIRVQGSGSDQNQIGILLGSPTDVTDLMPNNATVMDDVVVQDTAGNGIDAEYFAGSKWVNVEVGGTGGKAYNFCGVAYSLSSLPCQFGDFTNILADTTGDVGFYVDQGANANTPQQMVFSALWAGSTTSAALYCGGCTDITFRGVHIAKGDDGAIIKNSARVTLDADISLINNNNNGSYAVKLDGGSGNTVTWHAQSAFTLLGYNGLEEINSSTGNMLYGDPAACTVGVAFGGAATGLTYSTQSCLYDVQGRKVRMQFFDQLSAKGSSTGAATLTGLPFTVANGGGYGYGSTTVLIGASGMALLSAPIIALPNPGTTTANIGGQGTTGTSFLAETNFGNSSVLTGPIEYFKP